MMTEPTTSPPAIGATGQRKGSFLRAFLSSASGTGLSRVLGAARDIAIASVLGADASSDAFWIAFTVPNVFRRFVADEGLTGVLVPLIADAESVDGVDRARRVVNAALSMLLFGNLVLCSAGMLFPELLVKAFAYSFVDDPAKFRLTAHLTVMLFPFLSFVSLVSFIEGILNHRGHFFWPKVAPGLPSLAIVVAAFTVAPSLEHPEYAIAGGVLVGGLLHFLICVPPLLRLWGPVRPSLEFKLPRVRRMVTEMGKVIAIGVFAQVQILVLRQLAAGLDEGAVTRYWYANRLVDLAQGTIAVAIGSALLPTVSQAIAAGDWNRFREDFGYGLRVAAFMLVPVAAVLVGFSVPVTAILFRVGRYTLEDVQLTATTLVSLTPFLLAVAGINIVKKAYFALGDRNTLLWVGALGVGLTVLLGWWWTGRWGIVGLGLALSGSSVFQLVAYFVLLRRRLGARLELVSILGSFVRIVLASLPVAAVLWGVAGLGHWEDGPRSVLNLALLVGGLALAAGVYLGAAWVLRVRELQSLISLLRR